MARRKQQPASAPTPDIEVTLHRRLCCANRAIVESGAWAEQTPLADRIRDRKRRAFHASGSYEERTRAQLAVALDSVETYGMVGRYEQICGQNRVEPWDETQRSKKAGNRADRGKA